MEEGDSIDFTDNEIREELGKLGYHDVPGERLWEFKKDLELLIRHERSKSSQNTSLSSQAHADTSSLSGGPAKVPVHRERIPLDENRRWENPHIQKHTTYLHREGKENYQGFSADPVMMKPLPPGPLKMEDHYSLYGPDTSRLNIRDDVSETDSERRLMKRKVLRKAEDGSRMIDESVTESEAGSLLELDERLKELGIHDHYSKRRPETARSEPPYRRHPDDQRPASVILRPCEHPHTRHLRKSDPVARFQQFQQSWAQQRAPGEKNHKQLRWNVREHMLSQDQVFEKKAPRVFVKNNYVIPSDKKRSSLRWQIRTDIAQGNMPQHGFYHEY